VITKIQKKHEPKKEGRVECAQRCSNLNARLLAGYNKNERHISVELNRQLGQSCGCGKQLDINEDNQMSRRFSCKKRFCTTCVRLNAWKRDMSLYPSIHEICEANRRQPKMNPRLWFVTLTLPTCEASELNNRLTHLQKEWRIMYNELKKDSSKGYVNGLRKLEINANPKKKKPETYTDFRYHAHLHVLIQGRGNAQFLRRKWLERHPEAKKWAQDIRPFDQEKGSLVELLKYLAKPVTATDLGSKRAHYQANAFIYDQLRGRRTIFSYGSIKRANKLEAYFDRDGHITIKVDDKVTKAFETSSDKHRERIMTFLNGHKAKASRPLAETIWHYVNGHYVNDLTRERLCSEEDVREAAAAGGKDGLKAYETEKAWREGTDQSELDQTLTRQDAEKEAEKAKLRQWQLCDQPVSDIRN